MNSTKGWPVSRLSLSFFHFPILLVLAGLALSIPLGIYYFANFKARSQADQINQLLSIASYRKAKTLGDSFGPTFQTKNQILWARILRLNGDLLRAGEQLKKSTPQDPLHSQVELERALLRLENGEMTDNLELVLRMADFQPGLRDLIYEGVVRGLLRQFQPGPAKAILEQWAGPGNPGLRYQLEAAHLQDFLEDSQGCLSALEAAQKLAPDNPEILGWIGKTLGAIQRNQQALEALEKALAYVPNQPDWELALAIVLDRLGRHGEALERLTAILERNPKDSQAIGERGRIYLLNQELPKAFSDLDTALRLEPGNVIAADNLRKTLFEMGKEKEARELGNRIPQMEKDQSRIRELIQMEIQKKPNDPDVMHELATILLRAGYPQSAVFWVKKALAISPNHGPSHELIAGYYEATGNPGLAADHKRKANVNPGKTKPTKP